MASAGTLFMAGCVVASATGGRSQPESHSARAVFEQFVNLLYGRRQVRAAFECCVVATGYRDHTSANFGSRATAMSALSAKLGSRGVELDVLHTAFDRDIGMVHLTVRSAPDAAPTARVEIFRVADGRIVEHWSVAA